MSLQNRKEVFGHCFRDRRQFMRCLNYVGTFYYNINIVFFFLANSMKNLFFVYCFLFFSFFYFLYYIIFVYYFLIMEKTNLNLFLNIWKKINMTNRLLCLRKDSKSFFSINYSYPPFRDQKVEIRNLMFIFMMLFHH